MQDQTAHQIENTLRNTLTQLQRIAHALEAMAHSSNPGFQPWLEHLQSEAAKQAKQR